MSQNVLENQKPGYGLERPGQVFSNPQTYRELDGLNWRDNSAAQKTDPAILLGTDKGRVHVPHAVMEREPTPRMDDKWIFGSPEFELTKFRGVGDPPALPENPEQWGQEDWDSYFSWVASDPQQFQLLRHVYETLNQHYRQQG